MDDDSNEPTLPPIPIPSSPTSHGRPARPSVLTRKRTHSSYVTDLDASAVNNPPSAASSDPAFFSGDEAAPGAENYEVGKRKKKMYSGSWWSHQVKAGKRERKRVLSRNFDSGVWMGSDEGSSGLSSDSLGSMEEAFLRDQGLFGQEAAKMVQKETSARGADSSQANASPTSQRIIKRLPVRRISNAAGNSGEASSFDRVREIVREVLHLGNQDVNLGGMDLTDLPSEVTELVTLTTEPHLVKGMLDHGRRFTTRLNMVLSNNLFTRMPAPLLELRNLRVLTLRNNKLTSIPPGIRNLTSLVDLNVSNNQLKYLPFEIIELMHNHKLQRIYANANPWLQPPEDIGLQMAGHGETAIVRRWRPTSTLPCLSPPASSSSAPSGTYHGAGAPSLTELVLRQLQSLPLRSDLSELMPVDATPPAVLNALHNLTAAQYDGGRACTACKRPFVQAAHQWTEWWHLSTTRQDVPFRRAVCEEMCRGRKNDWVEKEWSAETMEEYAKLRQYPS